jgi:hypothetical protein
MRFLQGTVWDYRSKARLNHTLCDSCELRFDDFSPAQLRQKNLWVSGDNGAIDGIDMWKFILTQIVRAVEKSPISGIGLHHRLLREQNISAEELEEQLNQNRHRKDMTSSYGVTHIGKY